jgi:Zn-dependent protease
VGLGIAVPSGVVACFTASHLALELFAWCLAAVSALALVHEAGHALVARLLSLEVHGLLFAAGGACCIADEATSAEHEVAYSAAGVVSQMVVLVATSLMLLGALPSPELGYGVSVFTAVNLLLILANCWPSGGSDGHRIVRAVSRLRAPPQPDAA